MSNLSKVQSIYAAFGQGDVPTILSYLSNDVVFNHPVPASIAPFGGDFIGKNDIPRFFMALGSTLKTTNFVPANFREEGNKVINDVTHEGIVIPTGKSFSITIPFTWTFNAQGEVEHWTGSDAVESLNNALLGN